MTLRNLLRTGQLIEHDPDAGEIARLLQAADRALMDARAEKISPETRFDAAYRAIMQAATAALWANGYRTSTNVPGHHRTAIQSLTLTVGLDTERIAVLDRLRHKRNLIDYTGEEIDDNSLKACTGEAEFLVGHVREWIASRGPDPS
jgi:hypothetical protein